MLGMHTSQLFDPPLQPGPEDSLPGSAMVLFGPVWAGKGPPDLCGYVRWLAHPLRLTVAIPPFLWVLCHCFAILRACSLFPPLWSWLWLSMSVRRISSSALFRLVIMSMLCPDIAAACRTVALQTLSDGFGPVCRPGFVTMRTPTAVDSAFRPAARASCPAVWHDHSRRESKRSRPPLPPAVAAWTAVRAGAVTASGMSGCLFVCLRFRPALSGGLCDHSRRWNAMRAPLSFPAGQFLRLACPSAALIRFYRRLL